MSDPIRLQVRLSDLVATYFATDEGRWLRVAGRFEDGLLAQCEYRLRVHTQGDDDYPVDILVLDLFVRDAEGAEWHAEKRLHPFFLAEHMERVPVHFFYDPIDDGSQFAADTGREAAFASSLYLAGVRLTSEGEWRHVRIGPTFRGVDFDFEHAATFDFALSPSASGREARRLVVRLSGAMPYDLGGGEGKSRYEHTVGGEERDGMAPVRFEVGLEDLLRAEEAVYLEDDDMWDSLEVPVPLVFRRTGETGEAQPGVTLAETYGE